MLTDDQLMDEIARGNTSAFNQLIKRYQETALQFCFRLTGDYHLAEDVVQETFVRLYQSSKLYDGQGNFRVFFYKMMNNICIDFIRKQSAERTKIMNVVTDYQQSQSGHGEIPIKSDNFSPLHVLMMKEKNQIIRGVIEALPGNYRQALVLKEFEGLKYREIAEIMSTSTDVIKVYIHRARQQLAELLRRRIK